MAMSALVVWEGSYVAPGSSRRGGWRAARVMGRAEGARSLSVVVEAAAQPGLRLTRRGRLAATLVIFAVACFVGLCFVAQLAGVPSQSSHVTTVRPGQSLGQIAAVEFPQLPPSQGVARIRLANSLNTADVVAGQRLIIPAAE